MRHVSAEGRLETHNDDEKEDQESTDITLYVECGHELCCIVKLIIDTFLFCWAVVVACTACFHVT